MLEEGQQTKYLSRAQLNTVVARYTAITTPMEEHTLNMEANVQPTNCRGTNTDVMIDVL